MEPIDVDRFAVADRIPEVLRRLESLVTDRYLRCASDALMGCSRLVTQFVSRSTTRGGRP